MSLLVVLFTVLLAGLVSSLTPVNVTQLAVPSNPALTNTFTFASIKLQFDLAKSLVQVLSPSYDFGIAYNVSCASGANSTGLSRFVLDSDASFLKSAPGPITGRFLFQVPLVYYAQGCELDAQVIDDSLLSTGNSTTFGVTIQHYPPIHDFVISSVKHLVKSQLN